MQHLTVTLDSNDDMVESQTVTVRLGDFPTLDVFLMGMYHALQTFGFTYVSDLKATTEHGNDALAGDANYLTLEDLV